MVTVAGSRRPEGDPGNPKVGDVPAETAPEIDLQELHRMCEPGNFRAWWSMPGDGRSGPTMSFSGQMQLSWDRRLRRYICSYGSAGMVWSGQAENAHGAFIAMLADRCGLKVDNIRIKTEEGAPDDVDRD